MYICTDVHAHVHVPLPVHVRVYVQYVLWAQKVLSPHKKCSQIQYLTNEEKKIFYLDVIQRKTLLKIAFLCRFRQKKLRKMHKIAIFSMGFL